MKKISGAVLAAASVCIVVGLAMSLWAGYYARSHDVDLKSAINGVNIDFSLFDFSGKNKKMPELYDLPKEIQLEAQGEISQIEIGTIDHNIEIIWGETLSVTYDERFPGEFKTASLENGHLKLLVDTDWRQGKDLMLPEGNIIITLPESMVQSASIAQVSGRTTLTSPSIDTLSIAAVSGGIAITEGEIHTVSLAAVSSVCTLDGTLIGSMDIDTVSGDVSLSLPGSGDAYSIRVDAISGSLTVGGNKIPSEKGTRTYGSGNRAVKVTGVSAGVTVTFE